MNDLGPYHIIAPTPHLLTPDEVDGFFDFRYLYFQHILNTLEKPATAARVAQELAFIEQLTGSFRYLDGGVGEGTIAMGALAAAHDSFPDLSQYVVAKEVSKEDVESTRDKLPGHFFKHPATVFVFTNVTFADAPGLPPQTSDTQQDVEWKTVALEGKTADELARELHSDDVNSFLERNWQVNIGKSGGMTAKTPSVLVIYRKDQETALGDEIPVKGRTRADFNLVNLSHAYKASRPAEFKAQFVVAPLARALAPGGRLIAFHAGGDDNAEQITREVWRDKNFFPQSAEAILEAVKAELGNAQAKFRFHSNLLPVSYALRRPVFNDGIPDDETIMAAMHAAVYAAQAGKKSIEQALGDGSLRDATFDTLKAVQRGFSLKNTVFGISRGPN